MVGVTQQHEPTVKDLVRAYMNSREALRARGVIRSNRVLLSDYAEWLAAKALRLKLVAGGSNKGFDAVDRAGLRYQIKARQHTAIYQQPDLRGFGDLSLDPFDLLVAVIVGVDYSVLRALLIPIAAVRQRAKGPRMYVGRGVLAMPDIRDVTDEVRRASESA